MGIYERILWRYNPLEKIPRLRKEYEGLLKYSYDGVSGEKKIKIAIKQSLLNISLKITTDEIISNSVYANIILENEEYILYYIYTTNPKSEYIAKNPIQYGACRLIIDTDYEMRGIYWTSQKTIGDIYFVNERDNHAKPQPPP